MRPLSRTTALLLYARVAERHRAAPLPTGFIPGIAKLRREATADRAFGCNDPSSPQCSRKPLDVWAHGRSVRHTTGASAPGVLNRSERGPEQSAFPAPSLEGKKDGDTGSDTGIFL